jgi:hypothetical protein
VCQQLDLPGLITVGKTCKRFRRGDGGLETVELPTGTPVVTALRDRAFPGGELAPSTRPSGCTESWVEYLTFFARQRRGWKAPLIAAGNDVSLFVDAAGRLLSCGMGATVGQNDEDSIYPDPTPVNAMAGIRVRCVAAAVNHSLALGWNGRVYSWGENTDGQLGHGDRLTRPAPAQVEGLEGVRDVAAAVGHSFAVTESGSVFNWGRALRPAAERRRHRRCGRD